MNFKEVSVSSEFTVSVPDNLTPEEEANYIASRIAFVDLEKLAAEIREHLHLWEQGKLVPMEDVLEELSKDGPASETSI
jgi:predicted transcriptional regulator